MFGAYGERKGGKERMERRRKEGRGRMKVYPQIYIYHQISWAFPDNAS